MKKALIFGLVAASLSIGCGSDDADASGTDSSMMTADGSSNTPDGSSNTPDGSSNTPDATTGDSTVSAGDGAIAAWEGEGPCIGGGGEEFTGTYKVTVDGEPVGPFSVWGVGVQATSYGFLGCSGIGGCARGQCWPQTYVNITFRNAGIVDGMYTGDRVVAADETQTVTVVYQNLDPEVTEDRSASGEATVTKWDWTPQQFTGSADITTGMGHKVTIEWDVDGVDKEI